MHANHLLGQLMAIAQSSITRHDAERDAVAVLCRYLHRAAQLSDRRVEAAEEREFYRAQREAEERREDAYWSEIDRRIDAAREDAECDRRGIARG